MARWIGSRSSILLIAGLALAFALWTYLVLTWSTLQEFDTRTLAPPLQPNSPTAQIASSFALLTWPGLIYAALVGLAIWAFRHRMRQLGLALLLIVPVAWGGNAVMKILFRRARPEQALDVLTSIGYGYPSSHLTAITAGSIAVGAAYVVTRQSVRAKIGWQLGAAFLVLTVAVDRWVTGAHYVSDIVGGLLYGALVATIALVVSGVSVPVPHELVQEYVRSKAPR